ncbi:MAG: choice-of-anchor J domain-containing protein, partial [Bacteroidota bacterium]
MLTTLRSYVLATTFLILLLPGFSASAQVTLLDEDFDATAGLPTGWTRSQATGSNGWIVGDNATLSSGVFDPGGANSGTNYAASNDDACDCDMSVDYLFTPVIDLTTYTSAELNFFYYLDGGWGSSFSVDVSTDNGATFTTTPVFNTASATAAWTNQVIDLTPYVG